MAVYSELAAARKSDTIVCVLAETHRKVEEWKNLILKKGECSGVPWLEAVGNVTRSIYVIGQKCVFDFL